MLQLTNVSIDYGRLGEDPRTRFTERKDPLFSWGARANRENARQAACRLVVDGLWDSGWVAGADQQIRYAGDPLPEGKRVTFTLSIRDDAGNESAPYESSFYYAGIEWNAAWIGVKDDADESVRYLRRSFTVRKPLASACLYACGLGYSTYSINGAPIDAAALDPAFTEWKKTCQYVMFPEIKSLLREGENCLGAMLGAGWRHNPKSLLIGDPKNQPYAFLGDKGMTAMLRLDYQDGTSEWIYTDTDWQIVEGPLTFASLFDGVTYDASKANPDWDTSAYQGAARPADIIGAPEGDMRPMLIPPITEHLHRAPIAVWRGGDDSVVLDFGQNIAGVLRMELPNDLKPGQRIVLTHSEELTEGGDLFRDTLRAADARDTYIAAGDARDLAVWQPIFTYHGFRYARIDGLGASFDARSRVRAIELRTGLDTHSSFRCGNTLVTKIHELSVETERGNMHSILTDCPQRDERMGWMNDATVRFEMTPYNFDIGRMFPKIIRDIVDEQGADGAITCTAPFAFGARPADPVCSSFLIAGLESAMHTGNMDIIKEAYDRFDAWENCLIQNSTDFIVNYSYYGDWAGPLYACEYIDNDIPGARSNVTPGVFMSSGYSYLNCLLLERFARWLGREDDAARHAENAEKIKAAILKKWYDADTGIMATGSQACQAFALCIGLIPGADCAKAAKVMRDDLVKRDYNFTTGNLCTRYLMDVLTEHGYLEDAWKLITKETYPSFGFMIQNEATTIWERFELMKNAHMNSHSHPMYGAVDYWMYAYLAGVKPTAPGWTEFTVEPYLPDGLLFAQAVIDTVKGDVAVRWTRRYGARHLQVTVPFGTRARIVFGGEEHLVGSGFHSFSAKE
ncbi:MAG: family 78 glycoside hydrolase catalytic domain [Christensenellales bacterium]|jgi:alpha-L-rhamnosidase